MSEQEGSKVSISYAWTSDEHQRAVIELAERLVRDGVDVALDVWDLKEGQDKYTYMESMVLNPEIKKVLAICNKRYKEKADAREGGVGTESQIISKEVYEKASQEKSIAVVWERDLDTGQEYLPVFFGTRIYVDLSGGENYEAEYEKLVRAIYGQPLYQKPPLGSPPAYLQEGLETAVFPTHQKARSVQHAISTQRPYRGLLLQFFDSAVAVLDEDRLTQEQCRSQDLDLHVLASIEKLLPLRNDVVSLVHTFARDVDSFPSEEWHGFFGRLMTYQYPLDGEGPHRDTDTDNFTFLLYEVFLYFAALLLRQERYAELGCFLHTTYFFRIPRSSETHHGSFAYFSACVQSLDRLHNQRSRTNRRVSVTAGKISARATLPEVAFDDLKHADSLLSLVSLMQIAEGVADTRLWFPRCSVYMQRFSKIPVLQRLKSRAFFERVRPHFGVQTPDDLRAIGQKADEVEIGGWGFDFVRPSLGASIPLTDVATLG